MLNKLVKRTAHFFCDNQIIEKEELEIYEYGLELLFSAVAETLAVIILSIILNRFVLTISFLIPFIILRSYAGGFHAKTHLRCFLTLLAVYAVFVTLIFSLQLTAMWYLTLIFTMISSAIIILLAPVESENKPLTGEERKKYRFVSIFATLQLTAVVILAAFLWNGFITGIVFSISFGQLTAALSLVAVKILSSKRSVQNEKVEINHG